MNKLYSKYFIIILFLFIKVSAKSQTDSTYIVPFPQNFSVMVHVTNKFNTLLHSSLLNANTFEQNRPVSIGIGFVGERVGLKLGYGFGFLRNKSKGDTKSLDLQYHFYGRKFLFDAIGQRYVGFYTDNPEDGEGIDIYKDLRTIKTGIFGQYVFNSDKFSYRAAYNQRDMQIKSSGSFLLGGGIYYSEIHCDIPYFFNDTIESKVKLTNFQIGPSAGYAYNWAITKKFFIFISVSAGINLGFNDKFENFKIYPSVIPRFSMGYNAKTWSFNIGYVNDFIYSYISDDRKIALSSGSLQFSVYKRFNWNNKPEIKLFRNLLSLS